MLTSIPRPAAAAKNRFLCLIFFNYIPPVPGKHFIHYKKHNNIYGKNYYPVR